jgi:hypothetical protein
MDLMLKLDPSWRFRSPGEMPREALWAFEDLMGRVVAQDTSQAMIEHFKSHFAGAANRSHGWSSNASWAHSDLRDYMMDAAKNALLFIEAFYEACEALKSSHPNIELPTLEMINGLLSKHIVDYVLRPPALVAVGSGETIVTAPERPLSFEQEVWETVEKLLRDAETMLTEGRYRPAVQEILWLLESVSLAFRGLDAGGRVVEGKYFNRIVEDLRGDP